MKSLSVHLLYDMQIFQTALHTNILVHVEGLDVLERNATGLVEFYELLVHRQRRASSWKTQHKEAIRSRLKVVDSLHHILGRPFANARARR